MPLDPLHTRTWQDENSRIEEHQFTTESASLISPDMDALIKHLYQIGELTTIDDINSVENLRHGFPNILFHRIDVKDNNPLRYKVLEYDPKTRMDNFQDHTGLVLGQWENEIAKEAIILAYSATVMTGLPRLALTTKSTPQNRRSYLHLTWPLRENGQITQILVAAVYDNLVIPTRKGDDVIKTRPDKIGFSSIIGRGKKLCSIKTQGRMTMPIDPERESISMQVRKVITDGEINALVN
jgi:hypothetical protein